MNVMAGATRHRRGGLETAASLEKLDVTAMNVHLVVLAGEGRLKVIQQHIPHGVRQGRSKRFPRATMAEAAQIDLPVPGKRGRIDDGRRGPRTRR
jgi:hypothetical protein